MYMCFILLQNKYKKKWVRSNGIMLIRRPSPWLKNLEFFWKIWALSAQNNYRFLWAFDSQKYVYISYLGTYCPFNQMIFKE